jgi:hypothetical protein
MPTLHYVRRKWLKQSKLQTLADTDDDSNDGQDFTGKKDNSQTSTLLVSVPTICQSSTSMETRDEAATTVIASSATTPPGNTLDRNTQKRLRDEHEFAIEETAQTKHPRNTPEEIADGCTSLDRMEVSVSSMGSR